MARRLFLLLFSAVMGITVMPDMLASADSFELTGANFREVETVPLPEPEPEVATTAIPVAYEVPVSVSQQVNYTVTAYSGEILADGLS
ncbi:MAG: hypothetical protein IJ977_10580, partial [Fibrobacter sp.]|nr:hypothetical protein [Fibrobacter sp.]